MKLYVQGLKICELRRLRVLLPTEVEVDSVSNREILAWCKEVPPSEKLNNVILARRKGDPIGYVLSVIQRKYLSA